MLDPNDTTILLLPVTIATLLNSLVFIPNFIPKDKDIIDAILKLKKLTIKGRSQVLNRFVLRQFDEKVADSIMSLDDSSINSEELFTEIDCYMDHRDFLIKIEKSYNVNFLLIKIYLVLSIIVIASSCIDNLTFRKLIFLLGVLLFAVTVVSLFKLWIANKKIQRMEAHSDFI